MHSAGFPQPPDWYPAVEHGPVRSEQEVEDRALTLNVVIACSYGMPTDLARSWLAANGLGAGLTAGETSYLADIDSGASPDGAGHHLQVEALLILAWALSLAPAVDWSVYCPDALASWLPDLRTGEGPARFCAATSIREDSALLDELDAAFCLTWGCAEANLRGLGDFGNIRQYVMWERRRALEWLIGGDWDEPDYGT